MESKITLNYNFGYKWFQMENVFVKGLAIGDSGDVLSDEKLASLFIDIGSIDSLKSKLHDITGHFAIIIRKVEEVLLVVDRGRSIPIYFRTDRNLIEISDSGYSLIEDRHIMNEYDGFSRNEYLAAGFVSNNRTLLKYVFQVGAGEIVCLSKKEMKVISYFNFLPENLILDTFENKATLFTQILDSIYQKFIKAINGRTVIIPLSGGYDSRSIAAMFKRHNYNNVICYSFGLFGNQEMVTSQRVAKILGYKWFFVETTQNLINDYLETEEFKKYVDFAANVSSFYIVQDYFAVRQMRKERLIPDDSVFMPGHSGDTLGGSNFLELLDGEETMKEMIKKLLDNRYNLNKIGKNFIYQVDQQLYEQYDYEYSPAQWFDYWCMKEWNPKSFANGVRVYDFFGYKYWLPLWDKSLLKFFSNLPVDDRIKKEVYEYTLETKIFEPLGINLSPNRRNKYSHGKSILGQIKGTLKKLLPKSFIYKNFSYDPINAKLYTRMMVDHMKTKGIKLRYNSTNSVKAQWYIGLIDFRTRMDNSQ